jgi:SNF2 family DNA or RNA helicase
VIICEPQIKPSLEVQAIARAHRMGQVNKVQVHRLILPSSVDEKVLVMLHRKQQDFDAFARESELANISEAAKSIITEERGRLGITSNSEIIINDLEAGDDDESK